MNARTAFAAAVLALAAGHVSPVAAAELPQGTSVRLVLQDRLKSGADKKGDSVELVVAENVFDQRGQVLIEKGAPASGTIIRSRKAGFVGREGRIAFSIDSATAVDGSVVRLAAEEARRGRDHKTSVIAAAIVFAPVALFMTGKNATIKPGTEFTAQVAETVTVAAGSRRAGQETHANRVISR